MAAPENSHDLAHEARRDMEHGKAVAAQRIMDRIVVPEAEKGEELRTRGPTRTSKDSGRSLMSLTPSPTTWSQHRMASLRPRPRPKQRWQSWSTRSRAGA